MIHELRISSLGVIAEATARFDGGFTAVTGETGAGKTMVVTGLGLLGGGRADPALVRTGAAQAAVEGWFDAPDEAVAEAVREAGGIVDEDGLTAARIIAARGRSVLGGRGVPTALMAEVVGQLLVIHGQHDQTRIGARALALLDAFAGSQTQDLAAEVAAGHAHLRRLTGELAALRTSAMERARELDLLEFSLAEIAEVDPQPGEDLALAAESERLAHADTLVTAAREAHEAIVAESTHDGGADAMGLLATARRALEAAAPHDPALAEHASSIRSAMALLGDVAADLSAYAADVDADPRRLAAAQQRRADLARLTRKYGSDVDEVLAWAAEAAGTMARLAGADDRIEELDRRGRGPACRDGPDVRRAAAHCGARPRPGSPPWSPRSSRPWRCRGPVSSSPSAPRPTRRACCCPGLTRPWRSGPVGSTTSPSPWPPTPAPRCGPSPRRPPAVSSPGSCSRSRWCSPGPTRCPRWSSTRSTPGSGARRPSRWAAVCAC